MATVSSARSIGIAAPVSPAGSKSASRSRPSSVVDMAKPASATGTAAWRRAPSASTITASARPATAWRWRVAAAATCAPSRARGAMTALLVVMAPGNASTASARAPKKSGHVAPSASMPGRGTSAMRGTAASAARSARRERRAAAVPAWRLTRSSTTRSGAAPAARPATSTSCAATALARIRSWTRRAPEHVAMPPGFAPSRACGPKEACVGGICCPQESICAEGCCAEGSFCDCGQCVSDLATCGADADCCDGACTGGFCCPAYAICLDATGLPVCCGGLSVCETETNVCVAIEQRPDRPTRTSP
jgi:hypothetical protein